MSKHAGFTLIELMVSIAIVGILLATAIPAYNAYRQRAYGAEAVTVVKQILDAQIAYFLEHDQFFPPSGEPPIEIYGNTPEDEVSIVSIRNNLNIQIKPSRFLEYSLYNDGDTEFTIIVNSSGHSFNLAQGSSTIIGQVDNKGGRDFFFP